jgi:hypothetical protein
LGHFLQIHLVALVGLKNVQAWQVGACVAGWFRPGLPADIFSDQKLQKILVYGHLIYFTTI